MIFPTYAFAARVGNEVTEVDTPDGPWYRVVAGGFGEPLTIEVPDTDPVETLSFPGDDDAQVLLRGSARARELAPAVRAYAEAHYEEDGWDFLIECWDDDEIAREIGTATTEDAAIAECRSTCQVLADRRSDVEATAF